MRGYKGWRNFREIVKSEVQLRRTPFGRSSRNDASGNLGGREGCSPALLGLLGARQEGEDALVHPSEPRLRGDVAAALEGLGHSEFGEDLPRPR